jgi:hypothetical protein
MTDMQKRLRIYVTHSMIPIMAAVAAIGLWFAIRRGDAVAVGLLAIGWSIYVVEEYFVHRFIFHARPPRQQFLFDALYRLHYGHHDQSANKHLIFTPLWFALPLTMSSFAAMSTFLRFDDVVITVCGGGVSGFLMFEWLHLTSHFKSSSKGRFGRYLTRRHSKHHHVDYAKWFTVSPGGQLVDRALGSDPDHYIVVPNVRTCGLAVDDPRLVRSRFRFALDRSLANEPASVASVRAEQAV